MLNRRFDFNNGCSDRPAARNLGELPLERRDLVHISLAITNRRQHEERPCRFIDQDIATDFV